MSYFTAHRLNIMMLSVVLPIYTLWYFGAAFVLSRMALSFGGLLLHMHEVAAKGTELQWHAVNIGMAPAWYFDVTPYLAQALTLAAFVATLTFFFHCRRVNREADSSPAHPKV